MDLVGLYLAHPFWWWVAAAVVFLAVEVATGTETLLWPSAAAAVVAVLVLVLRLPPGVDLAIFAVLTIAATLLARRYMRRAADGPDINDTSQRLVGHRGVSVGAFERGRGRVFIDGKEWAAELEAGDWLAEKSDVVVSAVLDGGRLKVRPA